MIHFNCLDCGRPLQALAGKRIKCRHCDEFAYSVVWLPWSWPRLLATGLTWD
jgi:hypothetical protein